MLLLAASCGQPMPAAWTTSSWMACKGLPKKTGLCTGLMSQSDWQMRDKDKQKEEKSLLPAPSHASSHLGELDLSLWFSPKGRVKLSSK